ncbi:hypothetical protein D9M71_776030 [compost metagenome]
MGYRIADGSKCPSQQQRKALVFRTLGLCSQSVYPNQRLAFGKTLVNECSPIKRQTRHITQALCKALGGLEHRVEIVLLHQFFAAITQDLRMDVPTTQAGRHTISTSLRFADRVGRFDPPELAIFTQLQAVKDQ